MVIIKIVRSQVIYSISNDSKKAYSHILRQLEQIDFEPDFFFLFLTEGIWKNYRIFTELFKERFPYAKMLGCTVGGYFVKNEIWTRGIAALLGEFDGRVEVFWANEKSATKTAKMLGKQIGKGWDSILLMFPAFYFPGRFEFIKFFINNKRYYRIFKIKNTEEDKRGVLRKYSDLLDKSKRIYPIDTVLKIISDKTGKNTPIIGLNLMPLEASANTPLILANYKNLKNGMAAMCFKGKINTIFDDVFPERGNSYEETFEIVKDYFLGVEEVSVVKGGLVIAEVNGMKPVKFLEAKMSAFKEMKQDEFLKKVEDGKLQMATPYGLAFISQKTYGSSLLGLLNFPLDIYPSVFSMDDFYDSAAFCGEVFRGGIRIFGKIFEKKKFNGFDFYVIDHNTIMSFGGEVHRISKVINEKSKSCFGIFSSFPSAYLPNPDRRYFSEIDDGICVNVTGTSAILEFT